MLDLAVLNDLRPLARGAHFIVSACAGLLVYLLISRTCSDTQTSPSWAMRVSLWALYLWAALLTHYCLDVVFRVP